MPSADERCKYEVYMEFKNLQSAAYTREPGARVCMLHFFYTGKPSSGFRVLHLCSGQHRYLDAFSTSNFVQRFTSRS
jgi:hypothetical protein